MLFQHTTPPIDNLKLVVTPVFFAISSSVAGISDYKAYGRISLKVVLFYMVTSIVAIVVGIVLSNLLLRCVPNKKL